MNVIVSCFDIDTRLKNFKSEPLDSCLGVWLDDAGGDAMEALRGYMARSKDYDFNVRKGMVCIGDKALFFSRDSQRFGTWGMGEDVLFEVYGNDGFDVFMERINNGEAVNTDFSNGIEKLPFVCKVTEFGELIID